MYGYILIIVILIIFVIIIFINIFSNNVLLMPCTNLIEVEEPRQDIYIKKSNFRLHSWFFEWFSRSKFPNVKYIIYCHGNAGNISHRKFIIDICKHANCNLLLFDYRGFGLSSGKAMLDQLMEDGETAYEWLRAKISTVKKSISVDEQDDVDKNIVVWGESMGGSVAVHLAQKYHPGGLILLATFSSLSDLIRDHLGFGLGTIIPKITYNINRYPESKSMIQGVKCPITIMHSQRDELIPFKHAITLNNNISHKNHQLIKIDGLHSKPTITQEQFKQLFGFHEVSYYHMNSIYGSYKHGIPDT